MANVKVAVFDTLEAANAFKAQAPRSLREPEAAPRQIGAYFVVPCTMGDVVARQRLAVLREDGTLSPPNP